MAPSFVLLRSTKINKQVQLVLFCKCKQTRCKYELKLKCKQKRKNVNKKKFEKVLCSGVTWVDGNKNEIVFLFI